MKLILYLAIAGALGALGRYGLGGLVQRFTGSHFPYGTLVINILGCFVIGLFMYIALNTDIISESLRITVTIGFLGAFTTFSSFSYETIRLFENGAWLAAVLNIGANLGIGLVATFFGLILGKITLGGM